MINALHMETGTAQKDTSTDKKSTHWLKMGLLNKEKNYSTVWSGKTEECGFRLILTLSVFQAVCDCVQWSAQMVLDLFFYCIAAECHFHFVFVFPFIRQIIFCLVRLLSRSLSLSLITCSLSLSTKTSKLIFINYLHISWLFFIAS